MRYVSHGHFRRTGSESAVRVLADGTKTAGRRTIDYGQRADWQNAETKGKGKWSMQNETKRKVFQVVAVLAIAAGLLTVVAGVLAFSLCVVADSERVGNDLAAWGVIGMFTGGVVTELAFSWFERTANGTERGL